MTDSATAVDSTKILLDKPAKLWYKGATRQGAWCERPKKEGIMHDIYMLSIAILILVLVELLRVKEQPVVGRVPA
jgi:hypothetical protein